MASSSLIVSLHDVTPSTFARVRRQVESLSGLGVTRTSLLAIPHYHAKEKLRDDPSLVSWLKTRQEEGHEVVLHGWLHQISDLKSQISNSRPGRWFYENLYTAGEAEFLHLGYDEAHARMAQGLDMFRDLGLKARGFIAPAWLMNPEVELAAKAHGFAYTNTISEIVALSNGRRLPSRSCVWSTRAAWRRICSLGWNRLLFARLRDAEPLRISLHPSDLEYPAIWRQISHLIRSAIETRQPVTYAGWIERHGRESGVVDKVGAGCF